MRSKGKRFIVLAFGERGVRYGVDSKGHGSPIPRPLVELLYSEKLDNGGLCEFGCEAFLRYSRLNIRKVVRLVAGAEHLRDIQFPTLGIGLVHSRLTGQFNWLGRLKRFFCPDDETLNRAYAAAQGPQIYREALTEFYDDNAATRPSKW
jgi:hypothetical protein